MLPTTPPLLDLPPASSRAASREPTRASLGRDDFLQTLRDAGGRRDARTSRVDERERVEPSRSDRARPEDASADPEPPSSEHDAAEGTGDVAAPRNADQDETGPAASPEPGGGQDRPPDDADDAPDAPDAEGTTNEGRVDAGRPATPTPNPSEVSTDIGRVDAPSTSRSTPQATVGAAADAASDEQPVSTRDGRTPAASTREVVGVVDRTAGSAPGTTGASSPSAGAPATPAAAATSPATAASGGLAAEQAVVESATSRVEKRTSTDRTAGAQRAEPAPASRTASPALGRALHVEAAVRLERVTGDGSPPGPGVVSSAGVASAGSVGSIAADGGGLSGGLAGGAVDAPDDPATQRLTARIVRGLSALVNQRGGVMTMRLDPPELGQLRIEMSLTRGVVSADFQAATASARVLLERNLATLRSALEGQGLSVERLSVQTSTATGANASGPQTEDGAAGERRDAAGEESSGRGREQRRGHEPPAKTRFDDLIDRLVGGAGRRDRTETS